MSENVHHYQKNNTIKYCKFPLECLANPQERIITAYSEITLEEIHAFLLDWQKRLYNCIGMIGGYT